MNNQVLEYYPYLIDEANAVQNIPPIRAEWIIDGMAAVRTVSPRKTWGEYADALLKFCTPPRSANPLSIKIIMDTYAQSRIKELTQKRRGKPGKSVCISGAEQEMPSQRDWEGFLHNTDNKTELISFLVRYYKSDWVRVL